MQINKKHNISESMQRSSQFLHSQLNQVNTLIVYEKEMPDMHDHADEKLKSVEVN